MTLLADVVATSARVAGTTERSEKKAVLAELFASLDDDEVEVVVGFLTGEVRQGRIGIGWATIRDLDVPPAHEPTLTVTEVDAAVDRLRSTTGQGSQSARHDQLADLFARATPEEGDFLGRLFVGELRTGALAGVVTDAIAAASGVKLATVRRAVMLAGDLGTVARLALAHGVAAVEGVGLEPLRPVQPMLASTAPSIEAALEEIGPASVEWKLDGAQTSTRYPGGVALRFARVTRYRHDKTPAEADTLDAVRALLPGNR